MLRSVIDYKWFLGGGGYDVLTGSLAINISNLISALPELTIKGDYDNKNVDFSKFPFDDNTFYELSIYYPVVGDNGVSLKYSYDSQLDEVVYTVLFESDPF